MIIISFKAEKVFEYLSININFNKDFSFIIGNNGSGKTTAIRLINALLTPSPKELNLIPFENSELKIQEDSKNYTIRAVRKDDCIVISIPQILKRETLRISLFEPEELEYRFEDRETGETFFKNLVLKEKENKVLQFILNLPTPFFLGLDRKVLGNEPYESLKQKRRIYYTRSKRGSYHRVISGNLSSGLLEVQELVSATTSIIRRTTDRENARQRNNLILSSFHYTKLNEVFNGRFDNQIEEKIFERKEEFERTLDQMGMLDENSKKEIETFFNKISTLKENKTSNKSTNESTFELEWLINKAQINRIYNFLKIIDESKERIDKVSKRLSTFLEVVNTYYKKSNKKIEVDPLGNLFFSRPSKKKKKIGLEALSSGEKQILIIFANTILREGSKNIFIIDEPEISLHLKWQERLINDLKNRRSNAQFILATHSPEIVAGYENKCMEVNQ